MTSSNKQPERVKVLVKVKRPRLFKAGADSGTAVNLAIDVEEEASGGSESLQIQLTIEEFSRTEDNHCETD